MHFQQFQTFLSHHLLIPACIVLTAEPHYPQLLNSWPRPACDLPVTRLKLAQGSMLPGLWIPCYWCQHIVVYYFGVSKLANRKLCWRCLWHCQHQKPFGSWPCSTFFSFTALLHSQSVWSPVVNTWHISSNSYRPVPWKSQTLLPATLFTALMP